LVVAWSRMATAAARLLARAERTFSFRSVAKLSGCLARAKMLGSCLLSQEPRSGGGLPAGELGYLRMVAGSVGTPRAGCRRPACGSRPAECPRQPPQRRSGRRRFDLFERHVDRRFFLQADRPAESNRRRSRHQAQDAEPAGPPVEPRRPPKQAGQQSCRGCSHTPTANSRPSKKDADNGSRSRSNFEAIWLGRPVASKCMANCSGNRRTWT